MKEEMDRAVMSTEARQTPERTAKCEAAKKRHKEFFDRVSTEVYAMLLGNQDDLNNSHYSQTHLLRDTRFIIHHVSRVTCRAPRIKCRT